MSKANVERAKPPRDQNRKDTLDFLEGMSEKAVEIYEDTLSVLEEGIRAGKNNPMLGYMSILVYADLLHGGAYSVPLTQQPYYTEDRPFSITIPPASGIGPPETRQIGFPAQATEAQMEIIANADVPHVFPKLITDQTAFVLKDYTDRIFAVDFTGKIVGITSLATTNLRTLVEGGRSVRGQKGKATEAAALDAQNQQG